MVVDLLRPSGALLAALALWAVGLLVLALAGLGGRVGPHPADPALTPPLPAVTLQSLDPRLGGISGYSEVGQRPLLSSDRRPAPVAASAGGPDEAPLDAMLTSVLIAGQVRMAIVQNRDDPVPRRVRVGELLEGTGWRLVDLQPRRALFEGPAGRRELELRVFDGTGAPMPPAPPTPRVAAGDDAASAPADESASAEDAVAEDQAVAAADPAQMTPEQQVEAIRRRIEARRAMRAQEGAEQRTATERANR